MASWRDQVAPDWADALTPVEPQLTSLAGFLEREVESGRDYLPAPDAVLRAFSTPLADVRVLIVGQDPYPTPGDAVGLSFAVAPGHPMPRSLGNIAKELRADTGDDLARKGRVQRGVQPLDRRAEPGEGHPIVLRLVGVRHGGDAEQLAEAFDGVGHASSIRRASGLPVPLAASGH